MPLKGQGIDIALALGNASEGLHPRLTPSDRGWRCVDPHVPHRRRRRGESRARCARAGESDGEFACCMRTVCDWPVVTGGWLHRLEQGRAGAVLNAP